MIELDASLIMEAFNAGMEAGFIMGQDTSELDTELKINGIEPEQ